MTPPSLCVMQQQRHQLYCSVADVLKAVQAAGAGDTAQTQQVLAQLHQVLSAEAALSGDEGSDTGIAPGQSSSVLAVTPATARTNSTAAAGLGDRTPSVAGSTASSSSKRHQQANR
jgi:hypothetical protein